MNLLICVLLAAGTPMATQEKVEAITRPSQDVVLSFVRPGQVAEVLVKEGDTVKAGQVLMRLDDKAEQVQMEQLKAQADDTTRLQAAEAQLAQRRVDLRKTEVANKQGAATDLEVDHARLDVKIADLSLELAKFEQSQAQMKYREAAAQIERMRITSPIDGVVERLLVEPGESVEAAEKIAQVVQIDPLWVDVPVPLDEARSLTKGASNALVEFDRDVPSRKSTIAGKIIHIAAVADSASKTLTVRVECPNPSKRPAGEHVYLSFQAQAATTTNSPVRPRTRLAARSRPRP